MASQILKYNLEFEYLEYRIQYCKTVEESYEIFTLIQEFIGTHNVSYKTYKTLFENCMEKYKLWEKDSTTNKN